MNKVSERGCQMGGRKEKMIKKESMADKERGGEKEEMAKKEVTADKERESGKVVSRGAEILG